MKTTRRIVTMAIISALYCALTVALNPISFGPVQFRVANLLMALMFFDTDFCFGLALGVFFGNITSPFGPLDWGIMPFITLASALIAYRLRRSWYVGMVIWALVTSAGVAYFPLGLGAQLPFAVTFPMVLVPQTITGYVGYGLFRPFKKQLESRR